MKRERHVGDHMFQTGYVFTLGHIDIHFDRRTDSQCPRRKELLVQTANGS